MQSKFLLLIALATAGSGAAQTAAPLTVKHIYTGGDEQTHFDTVQLPMTAGTGALAFAATAGPEKAATAFITRLAPGYVQDWTKAPARRWVTVVRGRAEIRNGNNEAMTAVAGDILLVEDMTGKGHAFRVLGTEPWVAVVVNLQP